MIKRSLQEVADFLGCYIAMDGIDRFWCFESKPCLTPDKDWLSSDDFFRLDDMVSIADVGDHDFRTLIEPRPEKDRFARGLCRAVACYEQGLESKEILAAEGMTSREQAASLGAEEFDLDCMGDLFDADGFLDLQEDK